MSGSLRKEFIIILFRIILAIEQILGIPEKHTKRFLCPCRKSKAQEPYKKQYVFTSVEHLPTHPTNASRTYLLPEYAFVRLENEHLSM